MKYLVSIIAAASIFECQAAFASETTEPSFMAQDISEHCIGSAYTGCVVYASGAVQDHTHASAQRYLYQLQGTGLSGSGENQNCQGGYCAVAILRRDDTGHLTLMAHVESADAIWFEPPKQIPSQAGPLIVAQSSALGSGLYNDDIVLRTDETGAMQRIDVQSWKDVAREMAPDANRSFDWVTDYSAFVGENGIASQDPNESSRTSVGRVRVFLILEGNTLKIGSPVARFTQSETN